MGIKKIVAALLIAAQVFVLPGCENKAVPKNELVMWLVGSEAQAKTIMELAEDFTRRTGLKVYCQALSWGDAHSKYLTSIAGGVCPDVGTMGLTWGMEFGELGAMVDLNSAFPDDVAEIEKQNFSGIMRSAKFGNKIYGIPLDMSITLIYYRTDMIPVPPDTWEDLVILLKELKSRGKGMVIDWGALWWISYAPFLWQAGGDFFDQNTAKVALDTPAAQKSLAFLAGLYKEEVPVTTIPLEQGMRTGDYPIAISGNWKIISLTLGAPEIKEKWAVAMLPKGPTGKRTGFIGGRIMGVFSQSKMKKEAWEFIKFLSQPDIQVKLYQASLATEDSYLPSNTGAWKVIEMDKKFRTVLESQARESQGPPPVLGWDGASRFVDTAIQMVIMKGADPGEELRKATQSMQAELDSNKR
jgi:ABC-type glycerol-3-phosphate transport system substrate-binding protein